MTRWLVMVMALGLAAVTVVACDGDEGECPSPVTGTGGTGSGAGGSCAGSCESGYVPVSCLKGATYVALLPECPQGTTTLDLLHCDACTCEGGDCSVNAEVHNSSDCSSSGPFTYNDVKECSQTGNLLPPLYVTATVTTKACTPSGEPRLKACQYSETATCPIPDACIQKELLSSVPVCVIAEGDQCPESYGRRMEVQEGGTCQCSCGDPSGSCANEAHLFSDTSCSADERVITADGTCQPVDLMNLRSIAGPGSLACTPDWTPKNATRQLTLCCLGEP